MVEFYLYHDIELPNNKIINHLIEDGNVTFEDGTYSPLSIEILKSDKLFTFIFTWES